MVILLILRSQRACIRSMDWRCCARVTPARSPWRAHVACIPRLRQRQSFLRMLLSQKSRTSRIISPTLQCVRGLAALLEKPWESLAKGTTAFASIADKMSEKGYSFATALRCRTKVISLLSKKINTSAKASTQQQTHVVPPADVDSHNESCMALLLQLRPFASSIAPKRRVRVHCAIITRHLVRTLYLRVIAVILTGETMEVTFHCVHKFLCS